MAADLLVCEPLAEPPAPDVAEGEMEQVAAGYYPTELITDAPQVITLKASEVPSVKAGHSRWKIQGSVIDPNGPLNGLRVDLYGAIEGRATTDPDGKFLQHFYLPKGAGGIYGAWVTDSEGLRSNNVILDMIPLR